MDLEEISLQPARVLEGTLKTLALRADEKGLELMCDFAPDIPEMLQGDPSRLRQIIVNLSATPSSSRSKAKSVCRSERIERRNEHRILRFAVSDTGIGIPAEKQK